MPPSSTSMMLPFVSNTMLRESAWGPVPGNGPAPSGSAPLSVMGDHVVVVPLSTPRNSRPV